MENSLSTTFQEFIDQRIYEIEAQKNNQENYSEKEKKMSDLIKQLTKSLKDNGLENLFNEFLKLQSEQSFELCSTTYKQGFTDCMQIPNLSKIEKSLKNLKNFEKIKKLLKIEKSPKKRKNS